jgi:flagellar hook assembly protein FlgD
MISENETVTDSLIQEKTSVYKLKTESLDLKIQTSVFAFPNPSRDFTTIEYSLANEDFVTIEIYDVNGILITTLMSNKQHKEGIYQVDFDTSNLSSGQYNCVLKTSSTLKNCRIIKTN